MQVLGDFGKRVVVVVAQCLSILVAFEGLPMKTDQLWPFEAFRPIVILLEFREVLSKEIKTV